MKSLLISKIYFPPQVGGISQYMVSVAKALGPEEICCLTGLRAKSYGTNNDNAVERELQARVYRRPYAFSPATVIQGPALAATLMEIMVRERPQVVQLASVFEGYLGLHLNRWLKLPYVVYAHGNEILQLPNRSGKSRGCVCNALAASWPTVTLPPNWFPGGGRHRKETLCFIQVVTLRDSGRARQAPN